LRAVGVLVVNVCEGPARRRATSGVLVNYNDDAKRTKGMYRQRTQKAWGHTAHHGWARLLLDRAPGPHHPRPGAPRRERRGDADGRLKAGRSSIILPGGLAATVALCREPF